MVFLLFSLNELTSVTSSNRVKVSLGIGHKRRLAQYRPIVIRWKSLDVLLSRVYIALEDTAPGHLPSESLNVLFTGSSASRTKSGDVLKFPHSVVQNTNRRPSRFHHRGLDCHKLGNLIWNCSFHSARNGMYILWCIRSKRWQIIRHL